MKIKDKLYELCYRIMIGHSEKYQTADERTINTFGQSQGYCAGVATPDPGEAPPMAEFNMI